MIRVIFNQGGLSSEWSFIMGFAVFVRHSGGLNPDSTEVCTKRLWAGVVVVVLLVLDQWDRATEEGRIQLIRTQQWSDVTGPG